jgi:hypothetical protein
MTAGDTSGGPATARDHGRGAAVAPRRYCAPAAPGRSVAEARGPRWPRLVWLHAGSRRVPAAAALVAGCAVALRVALCWRWDAYGALQLPLVLETACAAVIATSAAGPFGDCERAAGRWLPFLRLATVVAVTALAACALSAAGAGAHLAGGALDVLRNLAGLVGLGLLGAVALGGGLAWVGPTGYLVVGVYALYSLWHGPVLTTPWIWPARPPHDVGAAVCAGLVFACGVAAISLRGARDPVGE